jgi:hypothetical protein
VTLRARWVTLLVNTGGETRRSTHPQLILRP